MAQKQWVFDPDSGGVKIPVTVKREVTRRIEAYASQHYAGQYTRLNVRFRAQFCYIDAYQQAVVSDSWPPDDWPETREEYIERVSNSPIHLCRLRYFGDDKWGLAAYLYSSEKYELSVFPNGTFFGTPEEAFAVGAMYLSG